jgi:hypothetical protein
MKVSVANCHFIDIKNDKKILICDLQLKNDNLKLLNGLKIY